MFSLCHIFVLQIAPGVLACEVPGCGVAAFAAKDFQRGDIVRLGDVTYRIEQRASLLGARTLLGAPGPTTRSKKLLGAKGIAIGSKKLLVPTEKECGNECEWGPRDPQTDGNRCAAMNIKTKT